MCCCCWQSSSTSTLSNNAKQPQDLHNANNDFNNDEIYYNPLQPCAISQQHRSSTASKQAAATAAEASSRYDMSSTPPRTPLKHKYGKITTAIMTCTTAMAVHLQMLIHYCNQSSSSTQQHKQLNLMAYLWWLLSCSRSMSSISCSTCNTYQQKQQQRQQTSPRGFNLQISPSGVVDTVLNANGTQPTNVSRKNSFHHTKCRAQSMRLVLFV